MRCGNPVLETGAQEQWSKSQLGQVINHEHFHLLTLQTWNYPQLQPTMAYGGHHKTGNSLASKLDGPEYRLLQDEVLKHRMAQRETGRRVRRQKWSCNIFYGDFAFLLFRLPPLRWPIALKQMWGTKPPWIPQPRKNLSSSLKFLSSWLNKRSFLLTRLPSLVVAFCGSLNLSSSWGACHSVLLYKANTVLSKIQYHITAKVEMFAAMWYRLLDKTADIDRYIYTKIRFYGKGGPDAGSFGISRSAIAPFLSAQPTSNFEMVYIKIR